MSARSLRSLMLLSKPYPEDPRVRKEAESLVAAGHDVTVLEWARSRHAPDDETIDGVRVVAVRPRTRLPGTVLRNPAWWKAAARAGLRLHAQDPFDLVHAHDLDTLPAAVRIKRRAGLPLVYDSHELYPEMVRASHGALLAAAARRLEDRLLRHVDRLITVSDALADRLRPRVAVPVDVVHNFQEPLSRFTRPKGPFTLTYMGALSRFTFFPDAIDAVGGMDGVRFRIGAKRESLYEQSRQAATRHGNVDFLGTLTPDAVRQETLAGHAVLCLYDVSGLNNRLGIPNKLTSAMAWGRAVIVPEHSTAADIVADVGCGITAPLTKDGLRAAVARLRDEPDACVAMGRRGWEASRSRFRWSQQVPVLLGAYEAVSQAARASG